MTTKGAELKAADVATDKESARGFMNKCSSEATHLNEEIETIWRFHAQNFISNKEAMRKSIPLNRFGNEHDLKGAAVFLASDASDFVTGQVLVVDGGQSA